MSNDEVSPKEFPQEDYDRLSELLELYSLFDLDGLLGFLHALAVAPSRLQREVWLPRVLVGRHATGDTALARYCIELILRLEEEVQDAVNHGETIMPDDEATDECAAFASGYVVAAELDKRWLDDAHRWTFVSGIAYLANRLDLVPTPTKQEIERNLAPDPKALLRRQMGSLIRATAETFVDLQEGGTDNHIQLQFVSKETPLAVAHTVQHFTASTAQEAVGRNDVCPCGSGRKYKRCCMS